MMTSRSKYVPAVAMHDWLCSLKIYDMTIITEIITVYSDDGDREYPSAMKIRMDGSKPECPVTFWMDKTPVFSMAAAEIPEFCKALSALDCSA
jgi:hypothetical protein